MKKFLLLILCLLFSNQAHAGSAQTINYDFNQIDGIYVCYEDLYFNITQENPHSMIPHALIQFKPESSRVLLHNTNPQMNTAVSIRAYNSADDLNDHIQYHYSYTREVEERGKLYASIVLKNSHKTPCTGEDEQKDTFWDIYNIPENQTLFLNLKLIRKSPDLLQDPPVASMPGQNPIPHIEDPHHQGIPELPKGAEAIPFNSPNAKSDTPVSVDSQEQNTPVTTQNTNDKALKSGTENSMENNSSATAEGCSLQASATSLAKLSWTLWGFVMTGILFFRKRSARKEF